MSRQSRTLRYKPYRVTDEDEWLWVIWGLNQDEESDWDSAAAKRVSTLIREMQELDKIRKSLRNQPSRDSDYVDIIEWPRFVFDEEKLQRLTERGRKLTETINTQLTFYKWSPSIFTNHFEEFREFPQWNAKSETEYQEKSAIHAILEELCEGRIDRFRICRNCSRWFYAVAQHQVSCSEACRKKHASTSEDFKAKRREYMKKYRKQEQARNKRAKLHIKTQTKAR
jgi:hypothetical protein